MNLPHYIDERKYGNIVDFDVVWRKNCTDCQWFRPNDDCEQSDSLDVRRMEECCTTYVYYIIVDSL